MDVGMVVEAVPALEFGRRLVPAAGVVMLTAGTLGYLRRTRAERMLRDAADLRASLDRALAVPAYNQPPAWRTAPPPSTEPIRRAQPSPYAPLPPEPTYAAPPVSPPAYAAIPWEQLGGQDLRQTIRARYRALAFAIAGALMLGTPLLSYAAGR